MKNEYGNEMLCDSITKYIATQDFVWNIRAKQSKFEQERIINCNYYYYWYEPTEQALELYLFT